MTIDTVHLFPGSHWCLANTNTLTSTSSCLTVMTEVIVKVHSVSLVNVEQRQWTHCSLPSSVRRPRPLRPSHLTWAVSPPVLGSYHLQPPSPFIISVRTIPPVATIPDTTIPQARRYRYPIPIPHVRRDARRHHTTMRPSYDVTTFHRVARVLCDYDVSHVFL